MTDPATAVEWEELRRLMQERYPDLPFHEAYAKLLHDAFIKLPKAVTEIAKPALPHLMKQLPEIGVAVGTLCDSRKTVFASQLGGMVRDITSDISQSRVHNSAANTVSSQDSIRQSAQALTQLEKPKVTTLLKSVADNNGPEIKVISGTKVIGRSMLDRADYYGRWMQDIGVANAIQIYQGVQALKHIGQSLDKIGEETYNHNSLLAQGGGGPDGHAQHVYDFVETKIEEDTEGHHRYFIYHPDTNWIGPFKRLIRTNPLPASFCAIFDNLDIACQRLQDIRRDLNTDSENGKDIVLHLLIPGWYHVFIAEPLHFADDLQPFRIHGLKHKGKPYTTFNLPAAPLNLLDGVGNKIDPHGWNSKAEMGAIATWVIGGSALNFGSLALGIAAAGAMGLASGGLSALVVVPIWFGGTCSSVSTVGIATTRAVHNSL